MTLKLTPQTLEACYEYLRTTEPFKYMRLPSGASVKFVVTRTAGWYGDCDGPFGPNKRRKFSWIIGVSTVKNGHTRTLVQTMAHEMIHVKAGPSHGKRFKHYASKVCRYHGFDPKEFS